MLKLIWHNSMELASLALTAVSILFPGLALQPFLLGNVLDANPTILTASPPELLSASSPPIRDPWPGTELVVSSTYTNNDAIHDWAAYYIVEVRDSNDMTILLDFPSGTIDAGGRASVQVAWTPLESGIYELRTFAISSFENPSILSLMSSSEANIAPIDGTPDVTSFDECVRAGYPVMESFPRQCKTPDGRNFVEQINGEQESGIRGMVLLGPSCPVVSDPPAEECADKPYATTLEVTTSDQVLVIKEFHSEETGEFSVQVPPGEYAIRSAAAANTLPYCSSSGTIKVNASAYTETTVLCDTGIR
jgi:hypothetical protein